ncbi:biotin--[acetyl-CoA-carboxylase] ligase [Sneathiella sp. P13V-1]|uniref:biotin--[acetyl-CoA-carboxylase] ligase n=1 Tax=Sneathiella sp. P13V-1 TaxID=2697366 RepID=UPI00187B2ED2|nr:biotin--[acetyl-CoA-carboxylase] ligase [Sneathiella sp. P13V-1]MBE7637589.1 biotin--[acetyl-CoA-carboxylase] ligase [Sneathiella sp. P13V-1]
MGDRLDLPPFFSLTAYNEVDSTSIQAKRLAEEGAPSGQLVIAKSQNSGVGRRGRAWTSPKGNMYASLMIRPKCSSAEAAKLSFLVSVALYHSIRSLLPENVPVSLKWPNDVLVDGKKVAGILLESKSRPDGALDWLVIGTGVNINDYPKVTEGLPATALGLYGAEPEPTELISIYCTNFLHYYQIWVKNGFAPIRDEWLKYAVGVGNEVVARLPNEELHGIFSGLDKDGALILKQSNGAIKYISAGEVFFPAK